MKKYLMFLIAYFIISNSYGQVVNGPNGYKVIDIGDNNGQEDYTRSLILLHEAYNGQLLPFNNAIGTITAHRGNQSAFTRISVGHVYSTSSYDGTVASIESMSVDAPWKIKTCIYLGKKYVALDVPYADAHHNVGFQFVGWTNSTGENMKCVNYMVKNQLVNQDVLTNIEDFVPNMSQVNNMKETSFKGYLNVGTEVSDPAYLVRVKGKIRAEEIKVETDKWPDYVFSPDYQHKSLAELELFINENKHLPGIPTAKEAESNGIELGEMNRKLLQKIEELTLHLITKDKQIQSLEKRVNNLEQKK